MRPVSADLGGRRDLSKELLAYLLVPHRPVDAVRALRSAAVKKAVARLFEAGRLVKSAPVRAGDRKRKTVFYLNPKSPDFKYGSYLIPEVGRAVRFYTKESWHSNFTYGMKKLSQEGVLSYLKDRAVTAVDVAEHFNESPRLTSRMLSRLASEGKVLRRGRINRFGREVKLPMVGFVYGMDYEKISEKVRELKTSARVFPSLSSFIRRVKADSRQGELTPEMVFRDHPFNFDGVTLAKLSKYVGESADYRAVKLGAYKWFYHEDLILRAITEEELQRKIEAVGKDLERMFDARLMSGIALEILVGKAFGFWKEFNYRRMNVHIPQYNPYGREFDFVGLTRFTLAHEKAQPTVYVCEIKYKVVTAKDVRIFYEKLRHTRFLKLGENVTVSISERVDYQLKKDVSLPVWTLKGNVVPFFVGAGFTDEAVQECRRRGIILMFASDLLDYLSKRARKRIYTERIRKIMERWVKEEREKIRVGKMSELRKKIAEKLHEALGV